MKSDVTDIVFPIIFILAGMVGILVVEKVTGWVFWKAAIVGVVASWFSVMLILTGLAKITKR